MAPNRRAHQRFALVAGALVVSAAWSSCSSSATTPTPAPTVASVSVTPAAPSVVAGGSIQLAAVPKDGGGNLVSGQTVTWASPSPAIASVSSSGLVTGVAPGGPVLISATADGVQGTASITVTSVPVASVSVSPGAPSIVAGSTIQLSATAMDAGGNTLQGRIVTWTSSNVALATVSSSGLVTGVAPGGPATITATSEGISGSATTTVLPVPVATVAVSPSAPSVTFGATDQLTATPKDASGNPLPGRVVTWTSSNPAVASVSGSGLVTSVAVGGPVTITATCEGIAGAAAVTVTQSHFGAWTLRRQITVTAGAASAPAGYSVAVQLDHAALVTAGKSLPGGNDVRVAYWTGTAWVELDRVLDAASAWNTSATTIWFKTQAAIAANSFDANYYVFYGNPGGFTPPASPANVFLLADDFETANLNKWISSDLGTTTWAIDNTHSHGGTYATTYPPEAMSQHAIIANPPLNVGDLYFESWWYFTGIDPNLNVGLELRRASSATDRYEVLTCCGTGVFGWQVNKVINFTHTEVADPAGTIVPNSWLRVGVALTGSTMTVFVNGVAVNSATGLTDLTTGNVGFEKVTVPSGSGFWVDDVVIRRYASPEPTIALGSEQAAP